MTLRPETLSPLRESEAVSCASNHKLRSLLHRPAFLLAIAACLTAILLQSGEVGSRDTGIRLQNSHSFWTSEPPVRPQDYDMGLVGRNGTIHGWYGIGQSVLMLPFDIAGTFIERLPLFEHLRGHEPSVREMVVSYGCNTLVCVFGVLMCFRLLRRLEFTIFQAQAGALALLFGTTFLHYTQNMMENNLIMLLDLTGFCFQYEWLRSGRTRFLLIGSAALGANLLVRLTTGMDIIACGMFLLLMAILEGMRGSELRQRFYSIARIALPSYLFFFALDRFYQWYRFGSVFNTYFTLYAQQMKQRHHELPANFPWTTSWPEGILGPLLTPKKSIFLFDPLMIITLLLAVLLWRNLPSQIKAWFLAASSLLSAYILFYARYFDWSGDFAWGDRFVSVPVQLLALLAIPLLLCYGRELTRRTRRIAWGIAATSILVQLASVVFWNALEIFELMPAGHRRRLLTFVIGLRFENIVAGILGKYRQWGLMSDWMWNTPWQKLHATTPYFLPFMLWRDGSIPRGVAHALIAIWFLLLAALIGVVVQIVTNRTDQPTILRMCAGK